MSKPFARITGGQTDQYRVSMHRGSIVRTRSTDVALPEHDHSDLVSDVHRGVGDVPVCTLCMSDYCLLRIYKESGVPGDVVSLALVPDGAGMRVENGWCVHVALLKSSHRHSSGEWEKDAEERDEDEEALCECGVVARTHSCRGRVGSSEVVSGGREECMEHKAVFCWDIADTAERAYI